ncbi:MAG: thiol reductant ABC exporter subunit CydC [Pseudomonadota bacterium]
MKDLRFFLTLARPDRWWLRLGAALAAVTLLAGIGLMSLSGWFITASALAGLAGAGGAFNYLFASGGVRGFAMTRTVGRYAERLATHEATFRILARLRLWVFAVAAPLAPGRLARLRGGDLLSRVTQDVDALDNLYLRLLTPVIAAACGALAVAILLTVHAPLALPGVLGLFALSALGLPLLAARRGQAPGQSAAEAAATTRAEAGDLVSGLAELKAYGADARIAERLEEASRDWISAQRQLAQFSLMNTALLAFAGPASFGLGVALALLGGASAPIAALAGFVGFALFEAAAPLVQAGELYGKTAASARRLRALNEMRPTAPEPDSPVAAPTGWALTVDQVSFTYPDAPNPALEAVSLDLPEGARLALVGASGSGKSSLVKLLMRFYAPQSGVIRLGGADLTELSASDVRARLALVDQRAELLATTVRANLRLAAPDAQEDALWEALERARAADFVRAMPDGLATWIGEQGGLVSGGQARRIALARAFLKNAPVLLLDEPTEGLDAETEAGFLDALDEWLDQDARRTALFVTHRPALLDRARQAVVLEKGRIAETGSPDVLSSSGGAFSRLFPTETS